MNDIILSYHDSLLRRSDLELLQEGRWLNDSIISFMFEFFRNDLFLDFANEVEFVDPNVVQLIKLTSDFEPIVSSLELGTKLLVFFPLNDNESRVKAGGSHWSLLVYMASSKSFKHYDSMYGFNSVIAKTVANVLSSFFPGSVPNPVETPVVEQENSYDCGVHVIKVSELLCRSLLRNETWDQRDLLPSAISEERKRIRRLILDKSTNS